VLVIAEIWDILVDEGRSLINAFSSVKHSAWWRFHAGSGSWSVSEDVSGAK
jgi:hypothetical protein